MDRLRRLWRGDIPLPEAFWNWAVLGGILVNVFTSLLFFALFAQDWPTLALIVGYGLSIPYNIFATVSVWRSANRFDGDSRWADLAKGATVVVMILLSLT